MSLILSHPTGNQNVRQAAVAFAEAGLLKEFWTCFHWRETPLARRFLTAKIQAELSRRSFPEEIGPFVRTYPWMEAGRQVASRFRLKQLIANETGRFSVDAVYRDLDKRVAKRVWRLGDEIDAVYAYDDGALQTFRAAKALGLQRIYDHPIIHWRKVRELQIQEAALHPRWACTLQGLTDSGEKLARKDEEIEAASLVVVPSNFSRDSLRLAPKLLAAIEVIPYGCPPVVNRIEPWRDGKLKLLFVGGLTQAKGISYLLEAVRGLESHVELTLIGSRANPDAPSDEELRGHTWIPSLPNPDVLSQMEKNHVFILPSLHDGFSLSVLEAISRGLAVIVSEHTGAIDLIANGKEGFIIPVQSAEAIREKLEIFLTRRSELEEMRRAALSLAARNSWEEYRRKLVAVVLQHLHSS